MENLKIKAYNAFYDETAGLNEGEAFIFKWEAEQYYNANQPKNLLEFQKAVIDSINYAYSVIAEKFWNKK